VKSIRTAYAVVAYLSFLAVTAWGIAFLANSTVAPTTVDGPRKNAAWVVDIGLLLLFAVQHTVMARDSFKRFIPASVERATFVLASAAVLGLLFWQWRPIPGTLWHVTAQPWAGAIWVIYGVGWLIAISATFMIDHWDFVGLRQARARGASGSPVFQERWLYAWLRHPLMLGLLIAFWATPWMTVGHLLFAVGSSAYIAVGLRFEERGLRRQLGPAYDEYAARVPSLIPTRPQSRSVEEPPIGLSRAVPGVVAGSEDRGRAGTDPVRR
jgi:protein-S-isoprenylcysteine O-methyltransferase Ste14